MRWAKVPCGKNDNHDLSNGVVIVFVIIVYFLSSISQ
jgi:hypothetical protein